MNYHWNTDTETIDAFLQLCDDAVNNDTVFNSFRHNKYIKLIIENSPPEYMRKIMHYLIRNDHWLLSYLPKISSSDKVGICNDLNESDPISFPVFSKATSYNLSPTTLRYALTAVKLNEIYGDLNGINIVEIGGGYGGQCKVIQDIFKVKSYHIYDIPQVQALQHKYLNNFDVFCMFPKEILPQYKVDLVISWCAWSELNDELKNIYFRNIISKADNLFFGLNQDITSDVGMLMELRKPMKIDLYNDLLGGMVYTIKN